MSLAHEVLRERVCKDLQFAISAACTQPGQPCPLMAAEYCTGNNWQPICSTSKLVSLSTSLLQHRLVRLLSVKSVSSRKLHF